MNNRVLEIFKEISRIPRCSGKEETIINFIIERAKKFGHAFKKDAIGNLLVMINKGSRNGVILQAHVDMVCEKQDGCEHDFERDPIHIIEKDGWFTAQDTTLGADNGVAVAYMLHIIESPIQANIDLLFTIDEEVGLVGALKLDPELIRYDTLINLDSEESDSIYIGCSGGAEIKASAEFAIKKIDTNNSFAFTLDGAQGGHSGADIHRNRGNALLLAARLLHDLARNDSSFSLVNFDSGEKHNVIPRTARFEFSSNSLTNGQVQTHFQNIYEEWKTREPKLRLIQNEAHGVHAITPESSLEILSLLRVLPHGVQEIHPDMADLTGTSVNIAQFSLENGKAKFGCSQRSDRASCVEDISIKIELLLKKFGFNVNRANGYPGWKPNLDSKILEFAKKNFLKVFAIDAKIRAIHAGLETGVIGSRKPGLDMISFGPDIENPHSPSERVHIESILRIEKFLHTLLEDFAHA